MSATATVTEAPPAITAENMLRLFPDIDTSSEALSGHDEEQIRLMDEVCIVVDEKDLPIGNASKKICTFTWAAAVASIVACRIPAESEEANLIANTSVASV
jgi:hypothetical protein